MGKTFVVPIVIALALCATGAALAQPQPDPAPVPPPAQPPSSTPAPPTNPQPASPRTREKNRPPLRTVRRKETPERTYTIPAHVSRAETGATLTRSEPAVRSYPAAASAPPVATRPDGSPTAVGAVLLLLLGATFLALVFAFVPARALGAISPRLVERRADIGLTMALTLALGAAVLVVVAVS